MKIDNEFELLATRHGLSLNKNEHGYLDPKTKLASIFHNEQQAIIDKLEHDLASANCAARMFKHVLDNPIVKKEAVA